MNLRRFITPLRLMLVDDEAAINDASSLFEQAAERLDIRYEFLSCNSAREGNQKLQALRSQGKHVHAVAMDYSLRPDDVGPVDFLRSYINQNPAGYWFWSSAYPAKAYEALVDSPDNESLHPRMLTGYNKTSGGYYPALSDLMSRLENDLRKQAESETKNVILTDRPSLQVSDGSLVRKEQNEQFSLLDELVPASKIFDQAVIVHVPSLPFRPYHLRDAVLAKPREGRVSKLEQLKLRNAWIGRKYFDPVHILTASKISKDFDPSNWRKYATQFNLNLIWLDAISDVNWRGSILIQERAGTRLNDKVEAVTQVGQKAVWTRIDARNFNSQFRPWAKVYRSLQAPSFFRGIDVNSGKLIECDEGLPSKAASGSAKMAAPADAHIYIDWGDRLYDVRAGIEVKIQESIDSRVQIPSTTPQIPNPDSRSVIVGQPKTRTQKNITTATLDSAKVRSKVGRR